MDSVFEDCMAPRLNDPLGGTGHKESQIEARALIGVVKTDDARGAMAASGTEADETQKLKTAVDQQLATFKAYALPVPVK